MAERGRSEGAAQPVAPAPRAAPLAIFEAGCLARAALAGTRAAQVTAVFERSLYLRSDRQWLCLGAAGIGAGPLNLRCHLPPGWDWRARGVRAGDAARIEASRLTLGAALRLELAGARTWTPPRPRGAAPRRVRAALRALDALLQTRAPGEGLARLALREAAAASAASQTVRARARGPAGGCTPAPDPPRAGATLAAAAGAAAALERALHDAFAHGREPDAALAADLRPLIGLGPGLTPSGDDLLGGMLIALHLLGARSLRDRLWRLVQPQLAEGTNAISAAHLEAAARGLGHAALHALLDELLRGASAALPARVAEVDAVGHTSGWDALAGALLALRAWLHAPPLPPAGAPPVPP